MTIDAEKYIFTFGKHKGESYNKVFETNPGYIYWCHHNVEWFKLADEDMKCLLDIIEERNHYNDNPCDDYGTEEWLDIMGQPPF